MQIGGDSIDDLTHGMYFRRDGTPCDFSEWANLYDGKGRRKDRDVKKTTLSDGTWVSTVFLGLDHSFGGGRPLIFETMVFPCKGNYSDLDMDRYSTEGEAIAGHDLMVKKWEKRHD